MVGRLKDLMKYREFQVAWGLLDVSLQTYPVGTDVAVVGFSDEEAGDVAGLGQISGIEYTDEVLKTASGKMLAKILANILGRMLRAQVLRACLLGGQTVRLRLAGKMLARALSGGCICGVSRRAGFEATLALDLWRECCCSDRQTSVLGRGVPDCGNCWLQRGESAAGVCGCWLSTGCSKSSQPENRERFLWFSQNR